MAEAEKQEGQKTVVAFITGLLIGGLLVWVFSSSPAKAPVETSSDTTTETVEGTNSASEPAQTAPTETKATDTAVITKPQEQIGSGMLKVDDQKSGAVVNLAKTQFPTVNGWVVVRDYMDGVPGNILGAARYGTEEGLTPTSVSLLRNTVTGSSYQVVYYTDNGDKVFDPADDKLIEDIGSTFKAN